MFQVHTKKEQSTQHWVAVPLQWMMQLVPLASSDHQMFQFGFTRTIIICMPLSSNMPKNIGVELFKVFMYWEIETDKYSYGSGMLAKH